MEKELSNHKYFLHLCREISSKSTCVRRHVGALILKNGVIVSTGYNGSPRGYEPHCTKETCVRTKMNVESGKDLFLCVASHSEVNAIIQAAMNGISVKDCILYCTNKPCSGCLKSIINSGIKEVFYEEEYSDPIQQLIIERTNVKLTKIEGL